MRKRIEISAIDTHTHTHTQSYDVPSTWANDLVMDFRRTEALFSPLAGWIGTEYDPGGSNLTVERCRFSGDWIRLPLVFFLRDVGGGVENDVVFSSSDLVEFNCVQHRSIQCILSLFTYLYSIIHFLNIFYYTLIYILLFISLLFIIIQLFISYYSYFIIHYYSIIYILLFIFYYSFLYSLLLFTCLYFIIHVLLFIIIQLFILYYSYFIIHFFIIYHYSLIYILLFISLLFIIIQLFTSYYSYFIIDLVSLIFDIILWNLYFLRGFFFILFPGFVTGSLCHKSRTAAPLSLSLAVYAIGTLPAAIRAICGIQLSAYRYASQCCERGLPMISEAAKMIVTWPKIASPVSKACNNQVLFITIINCSFIMIIIRIMCLYR